MDSPESEEGQEKQKEKTTFAAGIHCICMDVHVHVHAHAHTQSGPNLPGNGSEVCTVGEVLPHRAGIGDVARQNGIWNTMREYNNME